MLSKAFDKSKRTTAESFLLSIEFNKKSLTGIFSVSVESCFLFPPWWRERRSVRFKKLLNWLSANFSQIFHTTLSIERGRLFDATSRSPSFNNGKTSAIFQWCRTISV
jgi:hypothetical protein